MIASLMVEKTDDLGTDSNGMPFGDVDAAET